MISCDIFAKCQGLQTSPDFTPGLSRLIKYRTASQGIYELYSFSLEYEIHAIYAPQPEKETENTQNNYMNDIQHIPYLS